jgi:hypothetical protein
MRLHLHLGAHKTATTHFQKVLQSNRSLYQDVAHYVPMDEFRSAVTRASKLTRPAHRKDVEDYLARLGQLPTPTLILSEENLIGEAKDIFRSNRLYGNLEKRAGTLREFVTHFSHSTIWFSIRSMEEFIPSIYCESLLHFRYRPFRRAFSGHYEQSWVPVVASLSELFPQTTIKVVPYEGYRDVLPKWVEVMTGVKTGWDLLDGERPKRALNHLAVRMLGGTHLVIPQTKTSSVIQHLSGYLDKKGVAGKFSPFPNSLRMKLRSNYKRDLEDIQGLGDKIQVFSAQ